MNHGHLCRLHLFDQARDDKVLATTFGPTEDKAFVPLKEGLDDGDILLDRRGEDQGRGLGAMELLELERLLLLDEGAPSLFLTVEVVQEDIRIAAPLAGL